MIYYSKERNSDNVIVTKSSSTLNFLYDCFLGRCLLKLFTRKFFSNLIAFYMNSRLSKHKINRFIDKNNINKYEYEMKKYKSYNDFFTRKVIESKRPINARSSVLISPCDSKLTVYKINKDLTLNIKDSYYSIDSLIDREIIDDYIDGYALVFRLTTDNYHRYCYVDSGSKGKNYHIDGVFHTVQPISLNHYNFFKTNTREYTILNTNNFGKIIDVEIGALGVGRIKNNHEVHTFKKGEEKGYFEFGGSTIVLLIKKNTIIVDEDILNNSKEGIETLVKYGEKIAKAKVLTRLINKNKNI